MERKKCTGCGKTKLSDKFYESEPSQCKECKKEYQSNYHERVGRSNVRKKREARTDRERHNDYLKHRDLALKRIYKINHETFVAMCIEQDYKCASCGEKHLDLTDFKTWKKHHRVENGRAKTPQLSLMVDHKHSTGKVRELLCKGCNQALGLLREEVSRIKGLLEYTIKHEGIA